MHKRVHDLRWSFFLAFLSLSVLDAYAESEHYQITSPTTGVVASVNVQAGQHVKAGDVLLEFDRTLANSQLKAVKAALAEAKINLEEAKKQFEQAEELYDRTVLSDHDLVLAEIASKKAQAHYQQVQDELTQVNWRLQHHSLKAPLNGKVNRILVYPGKFVNNENTAETLFTFEPAGL
jgi:multidrug efflux system membrane fusion protein